MPTDRLTHVILGDGIAGMSAARVIRNRRPNDRVVFVSNDPQPFYYRASLTNYIAGELGDDELWGMPLDHWKMLSFERIHAQVTGVDFQGKRVLLASGEPLAYDRLLIATGARGTKLQTPEQDPQRGIKGADLGGVTALRTIRDAHYVLNRAGSAHSAVVLGGGILGIEAAFGLNLRGKKVTLVHRGAWLLEKVVDQRAGELIALRMQRQGVNVKLNSGVAAIAGSAGEVSSVTFTDGARVSSPLLITTIGNTPNTEWLGGSNIQLNKGYIPVGRDMRVAGVDDVWAAGDVVHFKDNTLPFSNPQGLWQPAGKQGQVAGLGMATAKGQASAEYYPGVIYSATRAWDLDIGTLGDPVSSPGDKYYYDHMQGDKPVYKCVLVRNGFLVGALLLGDRREGHAFKNLMNLDSNAASVEGIEKKLLDPTFDLAAWVASRMAISKDQRRAKTVFGPIATLPPSLASKVERTTQLQIAAVSPMPTAIANRAAPFPLVLRSGDQVFKLERRLGVLSRDQAADISVQDIALGEGEKVFFAFEGNAWIAYSNLRRNIAAKLNGMPLVRPMHLRRGDQLNIGNWRSIVSIPAAEAKSSVAETFACLEIGKQTYSLAKTHSTLGSGVDNDIRVEGPLVSNFHAQINRSKSTGRFEYHLVDAESATGTFLNGNRVNSPVILNNDDVIQLGGITCKFIAALHQSEERRHEAPASAPELTGSKKKISLLITDERGALSNAELEVPGTIGRSSKSDLRLTDLLISSIQMRLEYENDRVYVVHAGSLNETLVDGELVPSNGRLELKSGGIITAGRCRLEHVGEGASVVKKAEQDVPKSSTPRLEISCDQKSWNYPLQLDRLICGRAEDSDIVLPDSGVSRQHCRFIQNGGNWYIEDVGSSGGTFVNGQKLALNKPSRIADGTKIQLGAAQIIYRASDLAAAKQASSVQSPSASNRETQQQERASGFKIDWGKVGDPLSKDLQKVVQEELDSCIGCHDCMRSCPLPDASIVSIAALNSYAAGYGTPSAVAKRFIESCTQCQACVPVCPADIHRSRIVLWNKLKQIADPKHRPTIELAGNFCVADFTIGDVSNRLAKHKIFGVLNEAERIHLLSASQFRRIMPGERLEQQGQYARALWLVLSGTIGVTIDTTWQPELTLVLLEAGQTIGELSVLADQPCETTSVATAPSTLLGIPKYVIQERASHNNSFAKALETLYVSRSVDVFLKRHPQLMQASDAAITALVNCLDVERYDQGKTIMTEQESHSTIAFVRRGFVKEIRSVDGREVTTNYLKEGDAFGGLSSPRRGILRRYEASTQAEIYTIQLSSLQALVRKHTDLAPFLKLAETPSSLVREGHTEIFHQAAGKGLLQASQLMVIDTRLCVDCNNCVDACERRHGASRLNRSNPGAQIGHWQVPASCYHCEDPVCLLCSVDGIQREPSGEIRIIDDNCIGCGACAERCPFDNIQIIPRNSKKQPLVKKILPRPVFDLIEWIRGGESEMASDLVASKCDLCVGYKSGPACVHSCPTNAAQRVDPLSLFRGN